MSRLINIKTSETEYYDIAIEKDFSNLLKFIEPLNLIGRKICIVSDSNVAKIYLETIKGILSEKYNVFSFVFEAGEENKNLDTVSDLYEYLILNKFDRKDYLLALGGGVVGDLTGYCAATYLRGIDFIQVPTSLLAQVDSSIGGKTGVDFRNYKNMVGAFHQPKLVYINVSTLNSLSKRQYNSGMGEVIKHGYIKDKSYYNWLLDNKAKIIEKDLETLEEMIYVSCYTKKLVVENDPKEQGERALLNFGHTLGHAIEKLMNFSLYHGECVVLGMIAALNISKAKGYITDEEIKQALLLFKDFEFPVTVKGITVNEVLEVSKSDKKMDKGRIKFIILQEVGNAVIDTNISDTELVASLKYIITA